LTLMVGIDRYRSALWLRLVTASASAVGLIGAFISLYGECLAAPYAHLDPLVVSLWLDKVQETVSLVTMLRLGPEEVLGFYAFPLITLGVAAAALVRSKPRDRFRWVLGIVALAGLFGLSLWEMRGTGSAAMVAAPMFAAAAVVVWPSLAIGYNLVLTAFVVSPMAFAALSPVVKPLTDAIFHPEMTAFEPETSRCLSMSDVVSMGLLPKGRVMAPIDLGPAILAETDHSVFAAPYHRNNDGNLALLDLMLAPLPVARQMLSDRHVDFVVTCRTAPNQSIIKTAPDGLEARLARGETPEFLEPINLGLAAKISVWRPRK
jgi:hypothetical protein